MSKYIEYSAYTGCISLHIYCLITSNIKSLLNVPKISHISRKISQVSRFPAKSPDSRNKFVFLPKQPLLELSPPVTNIYQCKKKTAFLRYRFFTQHIYIYTRFQKGFHTERYIDRCIFLFSCTCARVQFSFAIVQLVKKLGSTINFSSVGFFVLI